MRERRKVARCRRYWRTCYSTKWTKELEKRGHAFVRYADDGNVYVRSKRAGERVMKLLRRLYTQLKLRINGSKSRVDHATNRKLLGYSFWIGPGRTVKRRVAKKALVAMKETGPRHREAVRRTEHETGRLGAAQLPDGMERILPTRRHAWHFRRPRSMDPPSTEGDPPQALEARHDHLSRAARTGSLRRQGCQVPYFGRRWWRNSGMLINIAFPINYFDQLGIPRLAS